MEGMVRDVKTGRHLCREKERQRKEREGGNDERHTNKDINVETREA